MDIYRAIQTKAAGYTFFSSAQGTFSRNEHMQTFYRKASLSKFKKTEIISTIFSNHKAMRLEINYKEKNYKKHEDVEAKQHATKQPKAHWRNHRGNQETPRVKWKWKHDNLKNMGLSKSISKRKFTAMQSYLRK